jgi:hypothetical protein
MEKNMKLKQLKKISIKRIDDKLFLELPDEVLKDLSITELDTFAFTIEHEKIVLYKSLEVDIPDILYNELITLYKGNEAIIYDWLHTPKLLLENKAPIEILNTKLGLEYILDLINRLKTGDLS